MMKMKQPGKSVWGTTTGAGMGMKGMSAQDHKGPSNKNVMATRKAKANPKGMLDSVVGRTHSGPDLGNG